MNKKTRLFIWSLLGFLICASGIAIQIVEMHMGIWDFSAWNIFLLGGSLLGVIGFYLTLLDSLED